MMISALLYLTILFSRLKPGRKIVASYAAVVLLILTFTFRPELFGELKRTYVLKSGESYTESREKQFRDSYNGARDAGFFGAGFGVSVGIWTKESPFSNFSREKGNSLLATWEETGFIGTVLWIALQFIIVFSLVKAGQGLSPGEEFQLVRLLLIAYLTGTFFSSMFEDWVLSPSPLAAVFWATVGMSFGALRRYSTQAGLVPRSPVLEHVG